MARFVQAKPLGGRFPIPYIHITGRPETGKTQLAISFSLWLRKLTGDSGCYVWPTDGREHEYADALGVGNVVAPEANPLDVSAVIEEIERDLRGKEIFKRVNFLSIDTLTHLYRAAATTNQLKAMTGQGSSGHSLKAVVMMNVATLMMMVNKPACIITHRYTASKQKVEDKHQRESISELEEERLKLAFNIKVECFLDEKGYGLIVHECRERPGLKPFIIRDEPGGMFRTMPEKLMRALYETQAPAEEAKGWAEFGKEKPFPGTGDQFKKKAIQEMAEYFVEVDGRRFYAFGDPHEVPTKRDGSPGINGAMNHAGNTYSQVAKKYKAGGGKDYGELTVLLKEETERRVQAEIDAYLKIEVEEDPEISFDEEQEEAEQPELGLEIEAEEQGPGAAYVD